MSGGHLRTKALTMRFQGVTANSEVDLEVRPGEIVGLIGPNGAGKTTFFNCVTGFLCPTSGTVHFQGTDFTRKGPVERATAGMARTFQQAKLFPHLSVRENLLLGRNLHYRVGALGTALGTRKARRAEADARAFVDDIAAEFSLTALLDLPIDRLPYGTRRMVEVARAFTTQPRLLLLDEPAAGMDSRESAYLKEVLRDAHARRGMSMLLIEHDVPLVLGLCDRVYVLDFGRLIASGTPTEIRENSAVRQAYLGTEVDARV
jgi:branched-chain amino acid transport system ATP-binding protein